MSENMPSPDELEKIQKANLTKEQIKKDKEREIPYSAWKKIKIVRDGKEEEIALVTVSFGSSVDYGTIVAKGKELGLEPCPREIADVLRLENREQYLIDDEESKKLFHARNNGEKIPESSFDKQDHVSVVLQNMSHFEHETRRVARMAYIGGGIELINLGESDDKWPKGGKFAFMLSKE